MPPKPKFTRDELVLASLAIVSEQGVDALTARELAKRLGCSTRPIFTVFSDMDELKCEVRRVTAIQLEKLCTHAVHESGDFAQAVVQAVRFAKREPNLYELVFLSIDCEQRSFVDLLHDNGINEDDGLQFIQRAYQLDEQNARLLYQHMWVHCLGMGVLCTKQNYPISEEELVNHVQKEFQAMCLYLKQGGTAPNERVSVVNDN